MPPLLNFITLRRLSPRFLHSSMAQAQENVTNPFSMAFVTVPNEEVAKKIAHYEWEGKVNEDSELLLMIKTRTSVVDELTTFVKANHPYDVCEVISTSIERGNPAYLNWIGSVVKEK